MAILDVNNMSKVYSNDAGIKNIDLHIEKHGIYGLLGTNGAGKSTFMNVVTGYIGATSGNVCVSGKDVFKDADEAKTMIGYLPELPPVYNDMTVREYLLFAAELKKLSKASRKAAVGEVMELTKVADVADRLIKNLSKGYKQRVGLAQAILGYPELIILDEPSVGLDPEQIIELRELITSLKENHTVILSSHILSEVQEICDYVYIIDKGKLIAANTIEGLAESLNNNQVIELTVKGDGQSALSLLSQIDDVEKVEIIKTNDDGTVDLKVNVSSGNDIREKVSVALAASSMAIYSMKVNEQSLENIFLELTQNAEVSDNNAIESDAEDSESDNANEEEE